MKMQKNSFVFSKMQKVIDNFKLDLKFFTQNEDSTYGLFLQLPLQLLADARNLGEFLFNCVSRSLRLNCVYFASVLLPSPRKQECSLGVMYALPKFFPCNNVQNGYRIKINFHFFPPCIPLFVKKKNRGSWKPLLGTYICFI